MLLTSATVSAQQQAGSVRGVVLDRDFDSALPEATVTIVETGQSATTTSQGNFVLTQVVPGRYTLVFAKDGYVRQVRSEVVVASGQLTEVDVALAGDITEMDEFVVQDLLQVGGGTEAGLLQLRFESPSLMDSISSDLMGRAGASDAASALRLVSGASVADGKSAVIRGLPDRYVSSQMNGVRLPSADEDKRAVELDQFPSAVIESIQVTKTFMPDQLGDASGGAVDVRLKGVPDKPLFFEFKTQSSYNSQVTGRSDFLTYEGGGVHFWGRDRNGRREQIEKLGESWDGAVGVTRADAPLDFKGSMAFGGKFDIGKGWSLGGMASLFYERDSSYFENGVDDSRWVTSPGAPMTPRTTQGAPSQGEFFTSLLDVTEGKQSVQWGGLATVGVESENHDISLVYLHTRTTEDKAVLAEDTRGKEYYFPGHDPDDLTSPGHNAPLAARYLRFETLEYTERFSETLQLTGRHRFPIRKLLMFRDPKINWSVSRSSADLNQPDKRQFASSWTPGRFIGPPSLGLFRPPAHTSFKPSATFSLGNLQRIFKKIEEDSQQYSIDLELPFDQWSGHEGYLEVGVFQDEVERTFDQNTYSNFNDESGFEGPWEQFWSSSFPFENHVITAADTDVDYVGSQEISAYYAMLDLPLNSLFKVIGGVRFETTEIDVVNDPEADATWIPPGSLVQTALTNGGEADVALDEDFVLPAAALVFTPFEDITIRTSYSETVARQTFKEITPILQQEFLGGPVFIGNPELKMSELKNYDVRVDYTPYEGGLLSASWFRKDIKNPIEYIQRVTSFDFTQPVNSPRGKLVGYELETRHHLGNFWDPLRGLSIGANATFIDSEVDLTQSEIDDLNLPNIQAPQTTRDMTNAPEHIYNLYFTYDSEMTGTQVGLFYTVQGDTLRAGAGVASPNFVPAVYQAEYETLNLTLQQRLSDHITLQFQAKNLTNPTIREVYRSEYIGDDVTKTAFSTGVDYSIAIGGEITF